MTSVAYYYPLKAVLAPPVFGLIAQHISVLWFPLYMLVFLVLMVIMHESLRKKCGGQTIGW